MAASNFKAASIEKGNQEIRALKEVLGIVGGCILSLPFKMPQGCVRPLAIHTLFPQGHLGLVLQIKRILPGLQFRGKAPETISLGINN